MCNKNDSEPFFGENSWEFSPKKGSGSFPGEFPGKVLGRKDWLDT
jgi:hypothetical protein